MISGEKDMLLIDPQFTLSEAHKLAAEILESKKTSRRYTSHIHTRSPLRLAVLKQAFPNAKIVALPATVMAPDGWPARQRFGSRHTATTSPGLIRFCPTS
jgi:hypothetical protein